MSKNSKEDANWRFSINFVHCALLSGFVHYNIYSVFSVYKGIMFLSRLGLRYKVPDRVRVYQWFWPGMSDCIVHTRICS